MGAALWDNGRGRGRCVAAQKPVCCDNGGRAAKGFLTVDRSCEPRKPCYGGCVDYQGLQCRPHHSSPCAAFPMVGCMRPSQFCAISPCSISKVSWACRCCFSPIQGRDIAIQSQPCKLVSLDHWTRASQVGEHIGDRVTGRK